jgi:heme exporter protein A
MLRSRLVDAGLPPHALDLPVRQLSAGQQRRVALARLALWGARLWLLDEPASNLDADGQAFVAQAVDAHLAAGGSALIATHQALALDAQRSRIWLRPEAAP